MARDGEEDGARGEMGVGPIRFDRIHKAGRFIKQWHKFCKCVEVLRAVSSTPTREAGKISGSRSEAASGLAAARSSFSLSAFVRRFSISRCLFGLLLLDPKSRSISPNKQCLSGVVGRVVGWCFH
jgi:hypothetical protein